MFLVLAVTQMLGVGTTTLISHAAGRKDRDRAQLVFNQSQALAILVGALFFVLAMSLRHRYADSLGADPETAAQAEAYLRWFIPAMSLQFGLVAMGAALRGIGLFKPGMVVQTVDGHPQHRAGAAVDVRLAHRPADGRRRHGAGQPHLSRGRHRLAGDATSSRTTRFSRFSRRS